MLAMSVETANSSTVCEGTKRSDELVRLTLYDLLALLINAYQCLVPISLKPKQCVPNAPKKYFSWTTLTHEYLNHKASCKNKPEFSFTDVLIVDVFYTSAGEVSQKLASSVDCKKGAGVFRACERSVLGISSCQQMERRTVCPVLSMKPASWLSEKCSLEGVHGEALGLEVCVVCNL